MSTIYGQILLTGHLLTALQRINPHIPSTTLEDQVIHLLSKPDTPVLIYNMGGIKLHPLKTKGPGDSAKANCRPRIPSPLRNYRHPGSQIQGKFPIPFFSALIYKLRRSRRLN